MLFPTFVMMTCFSDWLKHTFGGFVYPIDPAPEMRSRFQNDTSFSWDQDPKMEMNRIRDPVRGGAIKRKRNEDCCFISKNLATNPPKRICLSLHGLEKIYTSSKIHQNGTRIAYTVEPEGPEATGIETSCMAPLHPAAVVSSICKEPELMEVDPVSRGKNWKKNRNYRISKRRNKKTNLPMEVDPEVY